MKVVVMVMVMVMMVDTKDWKQHKFYCPLQV
jgi:hypothetical protein